MLDLILESIVTHTKKDATCVVFPSSIKKSWIPTHVGYLKSGQKLEIIGEHNENQLKKECVDIRHVKCKASQAYCFATQKTYHCCIYYKTFEQAFFTTLYINEYTGVFKKWHENGQLMIKGMYKDGKRCGKWYTWYRTGSLRSEGEYKDGKKEGIWRAWVYTGELRSEGKYKNGEKEGVWKWWYHNLQLDVEEEYKDGKRDGSYKEWYRDGDPESEGMYVNGEKRGLWKNWYK